MTRLLTCFFISFSLFFFREDSLAQCVITGMEATASDCDGGNFFVTIDFEFAGIGNDGFKVQGNGINHGTFSYGDLPVTIGPLAGDGVTPWEFVAIDLQFPGCSDFVELGPVACGGGACEIFDLVADPGACNDDGTYKLWVNFQVANAPNDFFDLIYQGQVVGYFNIADLPVFVEHFQDNGEAFPAIGVCINDTPDCCAETEFEAPDCQAVDCDIFGLTATASDCGNGMFFVTIDFEYENVGGGGFKVQGNGINYGVFSYGDLPVSIGPLAGNGMTNYEFVVKDVWHPDCSEAVNLGAVDCPTTGDCDLNDVSATPGDCWDDGTFPLTIDFNVANSITNNFKVTFQGEVIASGNIANLPLVIEHFDSGDELFPTIIVCMNDQPDCCATIVFQAPDCNAGDCHIFDIFAEAHPCDDDGTYLLDLEFEAENVGSEGFKVFANDLFFGPFDYGETFYTIGPLLGGVVYEIIIKDNENPGCQGVYEFGPVFCGDDCHIFDLTADVSDCDDLGQFFVTLDFEFDNTGNDGFKVTGNGNVYGFFGYDDLPVTLGPFQTPVDALEFIVSDVQQPGCNDFVEVDPPNCGGGGGDCDLFNLTADVHPCLGNGTFYVTLDFDHENASGYFKVQGNGVNYGIFEYDQLPVSIGPLVGNGTTSYSFLVRDLQYPDCAADVFVGDVECPVSGDCGVFDLVADPGECHDDETYNVWLNFDFENATNNFYDVFHNGNIVDYFPLSQIPAILPHLSAGDEPLQTVTVCINDNPDCCASVTYEAPDCPGELVVWPGDANADNVADHFDLLNLGLAFGAEGPERDILGIEWSGTPALNWDAYFPSNLNVKHADCNGNGVVNQADLEAIAVNFGETHGEQHPPVFIGGTENDPPFYVDLPGTNDLTPGAQFQAPILLGSEDIPVQNLYGVAFTLKFDPEIIDPASLQLQYDPSWLGVKDVNLLTFDKTFADGGLVKVALVRRDQNNVSGHGQVAAIIGIIDNIAGKESMAIEILDVRAITENEVLVPLHRPLDVVDLISSTAETGENDKLDVFPNPANQQIFISHEDGLPVESVEIRDLNGRLLEVKTGANALAIHHLAPGVYTLRVKAGSSFFIKKLVKI